jgi:hypothetical protein
MLKFDYKQAGKLVTECSSFTSEELEDCITATENVLAYLEGRGPHFMLATYRINCDLESLRHMKEARKS